MFKQLGDQDATFLYLETPETPQHVGALSLVELPARHAGDFFENYKRHIASRLHLVLLLHQKLVQLPFDIDHPFWTDDDQIDIDYHIRHQTLPRPGRMSQLEELVGRLHSNFLDRSRPLWEFYVIDGLESGRAAIYIKVHHAAMDGASSQTLISTIYDPTPVPRQMPAPDREPRAKPRGEIEEVLRGMADHFMRQEIRALQFVPEVLKSLAKTVLPDAQARKYPRSVRRPLRPPTTVFNTAITSQRSCALRSLPLARFKRVARLADAKLNDVVLAVCAAALRRYLIDKHALPKQPLVAMVPVSLHTPGDTAQDNQNTAVRCTLATDLVDPLERLLAIREAMGDQKRRLANIRNVLLADLTVVGSGALVRGLVDLYRRAKLADRLPPLTNLVISNVPGPTQPLYIAGAKLLSMYPCSIPYHGSALNITVESYCDSLDFGLVACRRTVPDLAELADLLGEALAELEQAVAASGTAPAELPPSKAIPTPGVTAKRAKARAAAPAKARPRRRADPRKITA